MASKDAAQDELVGQTIAGRYRIISRLGAGGMGTAYRAWDEQAGVPVVIKIPKKIFFEDPKFAERFRREIRLLQGLAHPHIVPITDVGEHEGLPFVAMRFLPGGSLSNRRLRDDNGKVRPNPPGMLHLWLPAVAEALDFVHSQGVVHRDVKPANIFFDAFWVAYLGDFGIAKIVEESDTFDKEHTLTATHMGIGTQEYMCPEQFTPKAVLDGRADQYALAVMVYEMVAGTRPFTGATAHLIVEVTTQQPPPLEAHRRDLPDSLVEAVHRGLAKNPAQRFATCREFAEAVLRNVQPLESELDLARLLCPNPKCSSILKLPTSAAGRKGKCPKCQLEMKVADDLGALWLLDEAHRQRRAGRDGESSEEAAGVILADEGGLDSFKPVSSTMPIEKAVRRELRKVPPLAIWGGLAAALIAGVVVWNLLPIPGTKRKPVKTLVKAKATTTGSEKRETDGQDQAKRPNGPSATAIEILAKPPLINSIGMKLKLIPAGTFQMGSYRAANPGRLITISKPFYIGTCEITNAQWRAVMGNVPSQWKDDDRPVERVSWDDVVSFCEQLSAISEEKAAGRVYRLPTAAEWEYACRAGTSTAFAFGDDEAGLDDHGWFKANAEGQTHPVGQKKSNPWGLHDMHGNVWEWCSNFNGNRRDDEAIDPQGPSWGSTRVFRGGGWINSARYCRSAEQGADLPAHRTNLMGFRVALSVPQSPLNQPVGLVQHSSLSTLQAAGLVASSKQYLNLAHVTVLTPEVAKVLATFRGHSINLDGLTSLDSESARYLATFEHGEGSGELSLSGLASISPDVAKALAQFKGAWLLLDGLTTLSPEVAQGLAAFNQVNLHLNGVTAITNETARALSKSKCRFLRLNGLTTLTPDVAKGFVEWRGIRLCLGGLTELSPQIAEALLDTKGGLQLKGLTSLSVDVARILGRMKGEGLSLDGLTTLSPEQAQALAMFQGRWLGFDRVTTLSLETAQALAGFKGTLWLGSVSKLGDDVAQALAEFEGETLFLEQLNIKLPDSARSILGRNPKIDLD